MNKSDKWNLKNSFDRSMGAKHPPSYPNEMVVKLCSSRKYSDLTKNIFLKKKINVCEIGCLSGNNLRFFLDKKWNTHGIEINQKLIQLTKNNLKRFNKKFNKIKIGDNTSIPYKTNYFDVFVSINTIHYSSGIDMDKTIKEYSRFLKKNGVALIETPSKKHDIVKKSKKKKDNLWVWKWGGFRNNQLMGFFDNKIKLKKKLKKYFSEVEILERSEVYNKIKLHWYFAVCKK